jgi:dimethylglycine dehydrogenase
VKQSGLYDRLKANGAQYGETFGWERARWVSKDGAAEQYSFRRSNAFPAVAEECRAVRERVGLLDLSGFAKFDVTGPDAYAFLDRVYANRMPKRDGGVVLAHWLNENGFIEGEATITRLGPDRFYLLSAAAAAARDKDMLLQRRRADEDVEIVDVTRERGCLVVAGPKSRDVLRGLTDADLSSNAFRWMSGQEIAIAGVPTRALRVSYVGELGWELHCPMDRIGTLYDAVRQAGEAHGIADFGLYAMNSLRMEKAYRGWGSELTAELTLLEAGMARFAATDKDYVGKTALDARRAKPLPYCLAYLEVDADGADVLGNEPVYANGSIVGVATSGGYGHTVKKSLAFAYVKPELAEIGTALEIQVLGDRRKAQVIPEPAYDPKNERLRG